MARTNAETLELKQKENKIDEEKKHFNNELVVHLPVMVTASLWTRSDLQ